MTEEAMDVAAEEQSADTETKEETNLEDVVARVSQLEELLEHYKEESKKQKDNAKAAFAARDKLKDKIRNMESKDVVTQDMQTHVKSLEEQLAEKDKQIQEFHSNKEKEAKLGAVKEVAEKSGLKKQYLDRLDRFLDLDEIVVSKPATIQFQVDSFKTAFPDLFGASGQELEKALPSPRLNTGFSTEHYRKEYAKELQKGLNNANPEKLIELKKLIDG